MFLEVIRGPGRAHLPSATPGCLHWRSRVISQHSTLGEGGRGQNPQQVAWAESEINQKQQPIALNLGGSQLATPGHQGASSVSSCSSVHAGRENRFRSDWKSACSRLRVMEIKAKEAEEHGGGYRHRLRLKAPTVTHTPEADGKPGR